MITIERLYVETRQGLDIILYYYPQATRCVEEPKRKFKIRQDEKTASAVLLAPDAKRAYYRVCDFGDEGHGLSPVDVAMKEEGFTQARFHELIVRLAARHNVTDELNRSVNVPRREEREAGEGEKEGDRPFKLLKKIPEEHLKVFGPRVTQEHADALHWSEAEYVGYVKGGRVYLKYSTEHYPIFMRECETEEGKRFYKIYEPLNPEKQYRFSYTPQGVKPKKFINGWRELLHEIDVANTMKEPEEEEVKKVPEAFICSGERDAICCLSMGGHPLWFNSETYTMEQSEYEMIMQRVETLYNIPDIDETGVRKGTELAMRFMEVRTVWLPDWLKTYKDNRGKPRKDFRDWIELRQTKNDFQNIKTTAMPARFWSVVRKDKQEEYVISSVRLFYFLQLNGFRALKDNDSDAARYIRIEGNIVTAVRPRDVRKFVREWAETNYLNEKVRNLIVNSVRFSESALESLKEVELNFTSYTADMQAFFFENKVVEVTKEGIKEYRKGEAPSACYVWRENVIPHKVRLLEPMVSVMTTKEGGFDVKLKGEEKSPFLGYLINSSRLYWRKEMEAPFLINGETEESLKAMEAYRYYHRFCIDGDNLTEKEIAEQKQCLLNKLFVVGYMLHHYKTPSRPWAPIAMDYKIGDTGECNGRSGKSFLFRTLAMFANTVSLSGRNPKLMDNPHVFDQVTKHTDFVLVDDCAQYLNMNLFYDLITSDMTVNPKNNRSYTIPFAQSPKFCFSTNYVPSDFNASSVARSLYVVFSDYYHENTSEKEYRESRRIADDFGFDLYSEAYTEEQWNADINVLIQCEAFYLSLAGENIKIQPPMDNIIHRKRIQDMGDNFQEWAETYFAPEGDHLNKALVRRVVSESYRSYANVQKITTKAFTKKLIAYIEVCPWIKRLNPPEMCNKQGRIMQRVQGVLEDMIYVEAEPEAEAEAAAGTNQTEAKEAQLPF